jgi:EAL domain-containing protein (putative c-di-GMP-specific phosphodiesterase class I)
VAEGVETIEQAESLVRLGCIHAQGFYYARPLPADDVAELFEQGLPVMSEPVAAGSLPVA